MTTQMTAPKVQTGIYTKDAYICLIDSNDAQTINAYFAALYGLKQAQNNVHNTLSVYKATPNSETFKSYLQAISLKKQSEINVNKTRFDLSPKYYIDNAFTFEKLENIHLSI